MNVNTNIHIDVSMNMSMSINMNTNLNINNIIKGKGVTYLCRSKVLDDLQLKMIC